MNARYWDERHGEILTKICSRFNTEKIKYFIVRNYKGLPNTNPSKDVDIIIEDKNMECSQRNSEENL